MNNLGESSKTWLKSWAKENMKSYMFSFGPEHRSLDWDSSAWLAAESWKLWEERLGRKHAQRNSRKAVMHLKCSYPASSHRSKVTINTIKVSSNRGAAICSSLHGFGKENTGYRRRVGKCTRHLIGIHGTKMQQDWPWEELINKRYSNFSYIYWFNGIAEAIWVLKYWNILV